MEANVGRGAFLTLLPMSEEVSRCVGRLGGERVTATTDAIGKVRRAFFNQGKKIRATARRLRLSGNTLSDRWVYRGEGAGRASCWRHAQGSTPVDGTCQRDD